MRTMVTVSDERARRRSAIFLALLGLGLLLVFTLIAFFVSAPTIPGRWDDAAQQALANSAEQIPAIYNASAILTRLGDKIVLIALAIAAASIVMRRDWRFGLNWLILTMSGLLAVDVVKQIVARARPPAFHVGMSPSFPSGHAGGTMLVYCMLAYLSYRGGNRIGKFASALILLPIIPVGLTRLVLGMHWLTDVFGGWIFGAGWALVGIALLELWQRRRANRPDHSANTPAKAPSP